MSASNHKTKVLLRSIPLCCMALIAAYLAGCQTPKPVARDQYQPVASPLTVAREAFLPPEIVRVATLPLYWKGASRDAFVAEFDLLLQSELGRSRSFEVVALDRDQMEGLLGVSQMSSVGLLPPTFLQRVRRETGADAILMADLTHHHPYRPISIGVRLKLIDLRDGQIIWAVDAVFNSADPEVALAARDFSRRASYNPYPFDTTGSILQSPRRFADFVTFTVFRTLPPRVPTSNLTAE